MLSLNKVSLLFMKDLTVFQKDVLDAEPSLVFSSKSVFFLNFFLLVYYICFKTFYKLNNSEGHFKYLFLIFDLLITTLLTSLIIKCSWFSLVVYGFVGACLNKTCEKISVNLKDE